MYKKLELVITIALSLAAVAVATSAVHTSFAARGRRDRTGSDYVKSWKDAVAIGRTMTGNDRAPVTIVTLEDFECPVCAAFNADLIKVVAKHDTSVRWMYVHYPLSYHKFAMPAARGAECAADLQQFRAWSDAIFRGRDSLGLKSWGQFAAEAGIRDTSRIVACTRDTTRNARIESGTAFGNAIDVAGTPTVIVNGWRFRHTPSDAELDSAIAAEMHKVGA